MEMLELWHLYKVLLCTCGPYHITYGDNTSLLYFVCHKALLFKTIVVMMYWNFMFRKGLVDLKLSWLIELICMQCGYTELLWMCFDVKVTHSHMHTYFRNWAITVTSAFKKFTRYKKLCWTRSWLTGREHSGCVDKKRCQTRKSWISYSSGVNNWPSCYGETEYKLNRSAFYHGLTRPLPPTFEPLN